MLPLTRLLSEKFEKKQWIIYYTAKDWSGKVDLILVNKNGKAVTVWMDEEPFISNGYYWLKYQTLDGERDGISKSRAQYLMIIMEKKDKVDLYFFPIKALSKGIMLQDWETVISKKMDGSFFKVPISWMQTISGRKKI